ncbi:hypothetical protein AXX17_ATUG03330 (mitochondrion) [Arabidopsis thaliana]|uniref:Uncharacterized protein n=1 Tax=Arabidopsis thaliana TaxID=3702 RepID=A0A178U6H0_ARATH|nr:hypothetical protein AXX17_ATUG03330 [Arabidopsis thaliana]
MRVRGRQGKLSLFLCVLYLLDPSLTPSLVLLYCPVLASLPVFHTFLAITGPFKQIRHSL